MSQCTANILVDSILKSDLPLLMLIISVQKKKKKNSQKHHKYYEFCYYAGYFSLGSMYNIMKQAKRYHETDFTHIIHPPSCSQHQFKLIFRK